MAADLLYIFVEGDDDERFFRKIIMPLMKRKYHNVQIFKYAQWKKEKTNKFLESIKTLKFDYVFTADIDYVKSVNAKKKLLAERFAALDQGHIAIVILEIESWYLAGLTKENFRRFRLEPLSDTEDICKEDFNSLYHRKFKSRIDFMSELLKHFSIDAARQHNKSFNYFIEAWVENVR